MTSYEYLSAACVTGPWLPSTGEVCEHLLRVYLTSEHPLSTSLWAAVKIAKYYRDREADPKWVQLLESLMLDLLADLESGKAVRFGSVFVCAHPQGY